MRQAPQRADVAERQDEGLVADVERQPDGAHRQRDVAEEEPLGAADRPVGAGQHPGRRALEQRQPGDVRLDRRHELDRRRAGPDHGHALAGQVVVVVPAGGVERRAPERLQAGDLGVARLAERAGAADQELRADRAARGLDGPALCVGVPGRSEHLGVGAQVAAQAVALGDVELVPPDLGLAGERPRPVRVGGERERVHVRRHVAGAAGVGVVAPGAAEVARGLEHHEVVLAVLEQADRDSHAGEAAADDRDADLRRDRRGRGLGRGGRRGAHAPQPTASRAVTQE